MFENKINLKKIDIYSLVLVIIGFAADRFSKEYIINLIQTQDREVFVNDYLNLIDFGVRVGQRNYTLFETENYITGNLSINIGERWFLR